MHFKLFHVSNLVSPQITFPAALIAALIAAILLAAIWCCTRPHAAAVLGVVVFTGIFALVSQDVLRIAVWMAAASAGVHCYFVVLPNWPTGGPSWCEVRGCARSREQMGWTATS